MGSFAYIVKKDFFSMKSSRLFFLLILFIINCFILVWLIQDRSHVSGLTATTCNSDEFREQFLSPSLYKELSKTTYPGHSFAELLTTTMLDGDFFPKNVSANAAPYLKYKRDEFLLLKKYYEMIWSDLKYFPVANTAVFFEDSWLAPRSYGGERRHEGTDIFASHNISNYYPIISITDGIIEQKGWLPLGGYRIGIRSESGAFFYYAHLASYEPDLTVGDTVSAGDILGFMGNSGYGKEGTIGKFPVHLHLGIYIPTLYTDEMSVNPYHILDILRKNTRKYTYS